MLVGDDAEKTKKKAAIFTHVYSDSQSAASATAVASGGSNQPYTTLYTKTETGGHLGAPRIESDLLKEARRAMERAELLRKLAEDEGEDGEVMDGRARDPVRGSGRPAQASEYLSSSTFSSMRQEGEVENQKASSSGSRGHEFASAPSMTTSHQQDGSGGSSNSAAAAGINAAAAVASGSNNRSDNATSRQKSATTGRPTNRLAFERKEASVLARMLAAASG